MLTLENLQMNLAKWLVAVGLWVAATGVGAAQFDFYKLGHNNATDFLPTDGVACTGGDLCSSNVGSNVFGGDLTFQVGTLSAYATGSFGNAVAAVVQDHENWVAGTPRIGAGLGVYHIKPVDNSDDNVTIGEKLTITFSQQVMLTGIGLANDGHVDFWIPNTKTFLLDGVSTHLQGSVTGLTMVGDTFTFAYGGTNADQFYLSSLTVTAVPEPETYAMLLAGLGLLGFAARRRKLKAVAAA
jgi:hypothetical protein